MELQAANALYEDNVEVLFSTLINGDLVTKAIYVNKRDFIECHSKLRFVETTLNLTIEPILTNLLRKSYNLPENQPCLPDITS